MAIWVESKIWILVDWIGLGWVDVRKLYQLVDRVGTWVIGLGPNGLSQTFLGFGGLGCRSDGLGWVGLQNFNPWPYVWSQHDRGYSPSSKNTGLLLVNLGSMLDQYHNTDLILHQYWPTFLCF
jgi:hypothetical protein